MRGRLRASRGLLRYTKCSRRSGARGVVCLATGGRGGGPNNNARDMVTGEFGDGAGGGGDLESLAPLGLRSASKTGATGAAGDDDALVIILDVKNMSCGGCAASVKRILESIGTTTVMTHLSMSCTSSCLCMYVCICTTRQSSTVQVRVFSVCVHYDRHVMCM